MPALYPTFLFLRKKKLKDSGKNILIFPLQNLQANFFLLKNDGLFLRPTLLEWTEIPSPLPSIAFCSGIIPFPLISSISLTLLDHLQIRCHSSLLNLAHFFLVPANAPWLCSIFSLPLAPSQSHSSCWGDQWPSFNQIQWFTSGPQLI